MSRRALLGAAAAVALLSFLFHASYGFDGIALFDEGLLADGVQRVLDGQVLGHDAFVPYGPAGYWLLAPVVKLCGSSVGVLRAATIVVQSLCDGGLFLIAAGGTTPLGALLATGFLVVAHGAFHKSFLVLAALLVLAGARLLGGARSRRAVALAGALCGAAFLFRHDAGAFGALALTVAIALDGAGAEAARGRRWLALAGGFAAVVAPAALVLLARGLDPVSWWDHEWQRIAVQERIRIDFPRPFQDDGFRIGRAALAFALLLAPCLHLAWGGAAVWRRWRGRPLPLDPMRVAGALFGLLLLNQARLIPSANHLFQTMAPIALALGDLLARRGPTRARIVGPALLALLLGALILWCARMKYGPYAGTFTQKIAGAVPLSLPTGGVRVAPDEAETLQRVVAAIDARVPPDGSIVTSPSAPLLAFLAGRRFALPYAEPSYYYRDERFQREAVAALERQRPELFVFEPRSAATFEFEQEAPLVAAWLARHYRSAASIGRFTLFERVD